MRKYPFLLISLLVLLTVLMGACAPAPAAPEEPAAAEEPAADEPAPTFSATPVGDPAVAQQEEECLAALASAEDPLAPAMARTYNNDIQHTGLFPCAQFTGSMTEPNEVVTQRSTTLYDTPFNIAMLGPEEIYIYGGCGGQATPPSWVSYVAKVDPVTLDEIWRTELADATENNQAHLCGAVDSLADGSLIATADHALLKLDPETGEIIAQIENVPAGEAAPEDVTQNGAGYFADGTIILKTWNRIAGCELNGIFAMYGCMGTMPGEPAAPSVLSAVDPDTFEVIDSVVLDANYGSRFSTTNYEGIDYVYLTDTSSFVRYIWDGSNLTLDSDWGPVDYTLKGQAGGGTPTIMGEWIIDNTNGILTPMSIALASQADDTKVESIQPNESMPKGTHSTSAAKPMVDAENSMAYMCDFDLGTCSAIHVSDEGELTLAWKIDNMRTQSMNSLIGPADQRVFVSTSEVSAVTDDPGELNWGPEGANFTEQYQWRDAATGELLAASDFYFPKSIASQIPPGYGGIIYGLGTDGYLLSMHVQPAAEAAAAPDAAAAASGCDWAMSDGETAEVTRLDGIRGMRYCEISMMCDEAGASMYNTSELNNEADAMNTCPQDLWDGVSEEAMAEAYDVPGVWTNGPRAWVNDWIDLPIGPESDFNGLKARWFAYPDYPRGVQKLGIQAGAYKTSLIARDSQMGFAAGQPVFMLVDPDGVPWVMQAMSMEIDPTNTYEGLMTLGDKLELADGWDYQVVTLDEELTIQAQSDGMAPVTVDNLGNTYDMCNDETCSFIPPVE